MKIQCNVCEAAEAKVLCCADEAALCMECDEKVHAANKLASKHQRVPFCSSSQMPQCDICQEISGFFFCLQDRALLCRKCDVAIHTANSLVSAHQRFLLTGVKVGLESAEPSASYSSLKSHSGENISGTKSYSVSRTGTMMPLAGECHEVLLANPGGAGDFTTTRVSFTGSAAGSSPMWHMDEILGLPKLNQNYGFMDNGLSKADSDKLGYSDSSSIGRSAEEELDDDECLGQVPESSWAVPQIPSPPTASGLYWPKISQNQIQYDSAFVPDIYSSTVQNLHNCQLSGPGKKRRWQL